MQISKLVSSIYVHEKHLTHRHQTTHFARASKLNLEGHYYHMCSSFYLADITRVRGMQGVARDTDGHSVLGYMSPGHHLANISSMITAQMKIIESRQSNKISPL